MYAQLEHRPSTSQANEACTEDSDIKSNKTIRHLTPSVEVVVSNGTQPDESKVRLCTEQTTELREVMQH